MDYGFPQFTEAKILSEYIKTDAYKMEVSPGALPCLQKPVLPAFHPLPVHSGSMSSSLDIPSRRALPAGTSTAADGGHKCCVVEQQGHPLRRQFY